MVMLLVWINGAHAFKYLGLPTHLIRLVIKINICV